MIKFILTAVATVIALSLVLVGQASAHVLVMDDTKTKGAILHIISDDDPIAGEESQLYFDMQQTKATGQDVDLMISDERGNTSTVDTLVQGSLVTASYTFPTQGLYEIRYTVTEDTKEYVFTQSQRVSRGIITSVLNTPSYSWAQALLIASGVGLIVLGILAVNHRKSIVKYSTF